MRGFHGDDALVAMLSPISRPVTIMPKQKTHKGTKKRFRLTANGKVKHRSAGTSHLASRMSKKRRRNLRGTKVLSDTVVHQITRALNGYSL